MTDFCYPRDERERERKDGLSIDTIAKNCKLGSFRVEEFLDSEVLEATGYTPERFLLEVHDLMTRRLKES